MKRFRRVLSVAVTLVLIVALFSDSLYASFISPDNSVNLLSEGNDESLIVENGPSETDGGGLNIIPSDGVEDGVENGTEEGAEGGLPSDDQPAAPEDSSDMDLAADGESLSTGDELLGDDLSQGDSLENPSADDISDEETQLLSEPSNLVELGTPQITVSINNNNISDNQQNLTLKEGDVVSVLFVWPISDVFGEVNDFRNKVYEYEFETSFFDENHNGTIVDQSSGLHIADYTLNKDETGKYHLKITFNDNAKNVKSLHIQVKATVPSDPSQKQDGHKFSEKLADKTYDFTWTDSNSSLDTSKTAPSGLELVEISGGQYKFKMSYKIETTVHGKAYDVEIKDKLISSAPYELTNVNIEYVPADPKFVNEAAKELTGSDFTSKGDGEYDLNIPGRLYNNDKIVVTYDVYYTFDEANAKAILAGSFNFDAYSNTAKWKYKENVDGPTIDHQESWNHTVKPSVNKTTVAKSGVAAYDEGKIQSIDWTITITLSNTAGDIENLKRLLGLGSEGDLSADDKAKILELFGFDVNSFKDTLNENLVEPEDWSNVFRLENATFNTSNNPITVTFRYTTNVKPDYVNDGSGITNTFEYEQNGIPGSSSGTVGQDASTDLGWAKSPDGWDFASKKASWKIEITIPKAKRNQGIVFKDTPSQNNLNEGFTHRVVKNAGEIYLDFYKDGAAEPYETKSLTELGIEATFNDNGSEFTIPSNLTNCAKIVVHLKTEVINSDGTPVGSGFIINGQSNLSNIVNDNVWAHTWVTDSHSDVQSDSTVKKTKATGGDGKLYAEWQIEVNNLADLLIKAESATSDISFRDVIVPSYSGITMEFIKDSLEVKLSNNQGQLSSSNVWSNGINSAGCLLKDSGENVFAHIEKTIKNDFLSSEPDNVNGVWKYSISGETVSALNKLMCYHTNNPDEYISVLDLLSKLTDEPPRLVITYKTEITNLPEFYKATWQSGNDAGNNVTFTNTITYTIGDGVTGNASSSSTHKYDKVLNKVGGLKNYETFIGGDYYENLPDKTEFDNIKEHYLYSNGNENFFYYIDVNPYADQLGHNIVNQGADKTRLQLKDTMGKSLSLILDSLRVYEVSTNEDRAITAITKLSDYKVTVNEDDNSFTLDLPDEKHLLVVYWAQVKVDPADSTVVTDGTNRVEMDVYGYNSQFESTKQDKTEKSSGWAELVEGGYSLQLLKWWQKDDGSVESLAGTGVEFTLYKASIVDGKLQKGEQIGNTVASTSENPSMVFTIGNDNNPKTSIFAIEETKKPYEGIAAGKTFKDNGTIFFIFSDNPEKESLIRQYNELKVFDNTGTAKIYNKTSDEEYGSLSVTKKVTAAEGLTPNPKQEFTFKVTLKKGEQSVTGAKYVIDSGEPQAFTSGGSITITSGQTFTITNIPLGTEYEVTEDPVVNGYTPTFSPNSEGTVSKVAEKINIICTNNYSVSNTTAQLSVVKAVSGTGEPNDLSDKDFTFNLAANDGAPVPDQLTATVKGVGTAEFGEITYTKPGTYTYTISEVEGDIPNVTYSKDTVTATVKVTDNGDGTLKAEVSYSGGSNNDNTITNHYDSPDSPSATLQLGVHKTVNVINGTSAPNKEFIFTLTGNDGAPVPENNSLTVSNGKTAYFGTITFDAKKLELSNPKDSKTFNYTITEATEAADGWTYADAQTVTVTVTLTADKKLEVKVGDKIVSGKKTADFENTYTYGSVSAHFEATKIVKSVDESGKDVTADADKYKWNENGGDFTFKAEPVGDAPQLKKDTVTNDSKGKVVFENITFSKAGKYQYVLSEESVDVSGITKYDDSKYLVTITVTENSAEGKLEANVSYAKITEKVDSQYTTDASSETAPQFVNTYRKNKAEFDFDITKKVTGDTNGKTAGNTYTFTVEQINDESERSTSLSEKTITLTKEELTTGKSVKAIDTVIVTDDDIGKVYHYRVTEKTADYVGISFDNTVYDVYFTVVKNGDYPLTVNKRIVANEQTDNEDVAPQVVFTNTYIAAADAEINLSATKSMVGRELKDSDVFKFTLKALTENAPMPEGAVGGEKTVSNRRNVIDFGTIKYTENDKDKTYQYQVTENPDTKVSQVTNDSTVYTVTVKVTKDDKNNKMVASVTYAKNGDAVDDIAFVNTFTKRTTPTSISLDVNKEVTVANGETLPGYTYNFTATLKSDNRGNVNITNSKASVVKEGSANVLTAEFTAAGTYVFEISETKGSAKGITYDESKYTVTVDVSEVDNSDGSGNTHLENKVTVNKGAETVGKENITFTNTYKPEEIPDRIELKVKKTVEGAAPDYDYNFIAASDPDPDVTLETRSANITGEGESKVLAATFTKAGTYKFKISEVKGTSLGITYDENVYTVTVVVEAAETNGTKTYTVKSVTAVDKDGKAVTGLTDTGGTLQFTNKYEVGGLSVTKTVEGTKGVEERNTAEFGFKLTLTNAESAYTGKFKVDGKEVSSQDGIYTFTLKHGGKVQFTDIPVGVHYKVEETDAKGYASSVTNAEGDISSDAASVKTVAFTNTKDKDKVGLSVTKNVTGTAGEYDRAFHFTVELTDKTISGTYGEMTFENGIAHIELTSGTTVSATGLPADIGYTVVEDEANTDGYTTTSTNASSDKIEEGTTAEAIFYNNREKKLGNLSVTKTVSGTDADLLRTFSFSIVLSDKTISGSYGQIFFANGTATINLSHGQTVTAVGLPAGISYTVYEVGADDYVVTANGTTGVIPVDNTAHASFINTKDKKYGNLSVTKKVEGDEGWNPEQEFTFTVTLSDSTINGVYNDMNFTGGVATLTLKAGETAYANGLPEKVTYTVTEAEVEGFTQSAVGDSGAIVANQTASAVFINTYEAPKLGNLSVTKTVTGTAGDPAKLFGFRITLSDADINGQYGDMLFENGFATVYLSHGMTAIATGLPEGTGYTVVELDSEDYVVSMTGASGFIIDDYTVPVSFINHKDLPETPDNPHGDDLNAGVGKDRPHGDDMNAGVGMDDMNPATGNYEADSFANGLTSIIILWTMVFLFGTVVIARKRREEK